MRPIAQIFLDLDGPLLDGRARHYHCYRVILEKFGFKPVAIDEYWEMKRSLVSRRDLLRMSGAEEIYDDFLAAWLAIIESADALALDRLQDGVIECLRQWKSQGIELTLVTMRKDAGALERQLNTMGLRQFLDAVLVCDHAQGGEGKAGSVRALLQDRVRTNEALWVGDTEADWEAARSLGCDIVLVENGLRNAEYLRTLGNARVVPSISLIAL